MSARMMHLALAAAVARIAAHRADAPAVDIEKPAGPHQGKPTRQQTENLKRAAAKIGKRDPYKRHRRV
jgi:hypothetical protein